MLDASCWWRSYSIGIDQALMKPDYVFIASMIFGMGFLIYLYQRHFALATTSKSPPPTLTKEEQDEYAKLANMMMKKQGSDQVAKRMNDLYNMEAARSLKGIKDTTGSFPKPAKIPQELTDVYKHSNTPGEVENTVNKVLNGHQITDDEQTHMHTLEARGVVTNCGSGCTCDFGHCNGKCSASGFQCGGQDIGSKILNGLTTAGRRLSQGQNIFTGQPVLGLTMPFTEQSQPILVPA